MPDTSGNEGHSIHEVFSRKASSLLHFANSICDAPDPEHVLTAEELEKVRVLFREIDDLRAIGTEAGAAIVRPRMPIPVNARLRCPKTGTLASTKFRVNLDEIDSIAENKVSVACDQCGSSHGLEGKLLTIVPYTSEQVGKANEGG